MGFSETPRVKFTDVEVVRTTGLLLQCRIGAQLVAVQIRRLLSGTDVFHAGDRGVLVLPRELALNLGLVATDAE